MARDKLMEVLKVLRAEKERLEQTIATFERLVEEGGRRRRSRVQLLESHGLQSAHVFRRDGARARKRK